MDGQFRLVLFWVFTCFFVAIGIMSLAVLLGFRAKYVDPSFRKWALRTFIGSVTTAIVSLFSLILLSERAPILVTLLPPDAPPVPAPFEKVTYHYDQSDGRTVTTDQGEVVAVMGEGGGYQIQLPAEVANNPVRLTFSDRDGTAWEVGSFYPNRVTQRLRPGRAVTPPPAPPPGQLGSRSSGGFGVVFAAEPGADSGQKQADVKFDNFARVVGTAYGRTQYEWRIFVNEPRQVLERIQQVEYALHPTFPDPFRTSRDRSRNFELVDKGWGEFQVLITVRYTNGGEAKTSYYVDFKKGWPAPSTSGDQAFALTLDRIGVFSDGSGGASSWEFNVLVNGRPVVNVPRRSYRQGKDRNTSVDYRATPSDAWHVTDLRAPLGRPLDVTVDGKRTGPGKPGTATGRGTLAIGGTLVVVVRKPDEKRTSFLFHLSAAPVS
jgi:hypothetical protein